MKFTEDRLGKDAGQMMSRLQALGYGRVDEVRDGTPEDSNALAHDNPIQINGAGKGAAKERKAAENCMRQLLTARFASQVRDIDFLPESDLQERAERIVIKDDFQGDAKGTKAQKLLRIKVILKKRAWADDDAVKYPTSKNSRSQTPHANNDARKRRKLNGGTHRDEDASEEDNSSDEDTEETAGTTSPLVTSS